MALVGCQGRGCAAVVPPHVCHPFFLTALLVPWPEKSTALLGHRWSRSLRHPRSATADLPRTLPAPHRATAPVSPGVSRCIHDGHGFPSLDHLHDGGRLHTSRQGRPMALSYPCDRPVGAWRGRARPVWLSHGSSGRTTHEVMSCLRHRSPAAGLPAPPRPQRHSCWPTRPRGPRGCRPSATPQAAPGRCTLGCRAGASLGSSATSLRYPQHPATVASVLAGV